MTDIEQALAEALRKPLMANGVDHTANQGYHGWRCEHPDRYGPCDCFDELVRDVAIDAAATEPMQTIARQAAIGAAVLHEHKTCTPRECRMYSEYGFSWEGYRPMNIVPCRVAAIADALEDER